MKYYFKRIIFFIAILLSLTACKSEKPKLVQKEIKANPFNLPIEDLIEVKDTIKANETISSILAPHSVSPQLIHNLEVKSLSVFPLSKFKSGNELYIYAKWDSVETVKYLVYVQDEINYVVYDLSDPLKVYKKQRAYELKTEITNGNIKSGLIIDLQNSNVSAEVGFNTADIFESQIDFENLQENDSYKIVYEQYYVDKKPVKVGKILAAIINHRKKEYSGFLFEKEKKYSYYDKLGNSLVGMFLTAPIKFRFRITSRYSLNRFHPVLHRSKAHLGTDFAAAYGTPIQSTANGVILEASYTSGNGNYVKIKHNKTYTTQYLHMSKFASGIRRGAKVSQGQVIGYVGSTGLATGPHVCYRFWKNGKQVDPLREKNQSAEPLSRKYLNEFKLVVEDFMKKYFN